MSEMTETPAEAQPDPDLKDSRLYVNRELSWLDFNDRVLQLAEDGAVPLLERLKFLAIFVSNLDDFFMIRVAGVNGQVDARIDARGPDHLSPTEVLQAIHDGVRDQDRRHAREFSQVIAPELAEHGIRVTTCEASGASPDIIEPPWRSAPDARSPTSRTCRCRCSCASTIPTPIRTPTRASKCPRRFCPGSWRSRRTRSSRWRT
jgi:hypothetical protein